MATKLLSFGAKEDKNKMKISRRDFNTSSGCCTQHKCTQNSLNLLVMNDVKLGVNTVVKTVEYFCMKIVLIF